MRCSPGRWCRSVCRRRATPSSPAAKVFHCRRPADPPRAGDMVSPMKYVVAGYGSRGDVEPCLAVAAELQRRGHEVRVAVTVPPELQAYVASAGLVAVAYGRYWQ